MMVNDKNIWQKTKYLACSTISTSQAEGPQLTKFLTCLEALALAVMFPKKHLVDEQDEKYICWNVKLTANFGFELNFQICDLCRQVNCPVVFKFPEGLVAVVYFVVALLVSKLLTETVLEIAMRCSALSIFLFKNKICGFHACSNIENSFVLIPLLYWQNCASVWVHLCKVVPAYVLQHSTIHLHDHTLSSR